MNRNPFHHPPLVHDGKTYGFDHLAPFRLVLKGQGRDGADLTVRIRFSCHVYTKARAEGGPSIKIRDKNGQARAFSPGRYERSLALPRLCEDMIRLKYPSWISSDRRRRRNLAVAGVKPRNNADAYHVFYELWPSRKKGIDVEMEIKSAYMRRIRTRGRRKTVLIFIKRCYYDNRRQP